MKFIFNKKSVLALILTLSLVFSANIELLSCVADELSSIVSVEESVPQPESVPVCEPVQPTVEEIAPAEEPDEPSVSEEATEEEPAEPSVNEEATEEETDEPSENEEATEEETVEPSENEEATEEETDEPSENEEATEEETDEPSVNEEATEEEADEPSVNEEATEEETDEPSVNEENTSDDDLILEENLLVTLELEDNSVRNQVYTVRDKVYINVEDVTAMPGQEVSVDISVINNPGILGMTLSLYYNDDTEIVAVDEGIALDSLTFTPPGDFNDNPVNLLWDGMSDNDYSTGDIATVTFYVPKGIDEGTYELYLTYRPGDVFDENYDDLDVYISQGSITIKDYIPGDVNKDGVVSGKDITVLRRYIAGGYGVTIDRTAADVNGDSKINAKDITLLRQYVAGGYGVELK